MLRPLLALIAVAVLVALGVFALREGTAPTGNIPTDVAREAPPETDRPLGGSGSAERDTGDLELVAPIPRRTVSVAATPAAASSEFAAPVPKVPPTGLRVWGQVSLDAEDAVMPAGARVEVRLVLAEGRGSLVVRSAPVSPSGVYWVDLDEWRSVPEIARGNATVHGRLLAPGLELEEDEESVDEAKAGILTLNFSPDVAVLTIVGRVVSPAGDPVPLAHITLIVWEDQEGMALSRDALTDEEGAFRFTVSEPGQCSLRATSASHGVAHVSAEMVPPLQDVGDLVLRPRGVIAGRVVVGPRASGVAGVEVSLEPASGDRDSIYARTDRTGAFRFANLSRVPMNVTVENGRDQSGDEPLVVTPDVENLQLRFGRPTATIAVVDTGGHPAFGFDLEVVPVKWDADGGRWTKTKGSADVIQGDGNPVLVAFDGPGRYAASASHRIGEMRLTSSEILDISGGTESVELVLRPEQGTPIQLRVVGPEGEPIESWAVECRSILHGSAKRRVTSKSPSISIPTGIWTVDVVPHIETMLAPFTSEIEVSGTAGETFVLQATERGGRILLVLDQVDGTEGHVPVAVNDRSGRRAPYTQQVRLRDKAGENLVDLTRTFAPGTYTVSLISFFGSDLGATAVTVVAGETVRAKLKVEGTNWAPELSLPGGLIPWQSSFLKGK